MKLLSILLPLLVALTACQASGPEFQRVTLRGVPPARVFALGEEVVKRHYTGLQIQTDAVAGRLETGFVEYGTQRTLRQRVCLDVRADGEGGTTADVALEIFVPVYQMQLDLDDLTRDPWVFAGIDFQVQNILLEEIVGAVLLEFPLAEVVNDS